jgi:DNA-binding MarR family transcriptional regulator
MSHRLSKAHFEALAEFRYRMRLFLRFSEELTQSHGITPLQYQLLLQVRGFPGRDWATVGELAERLQAKHHGVVALVSRCEALGLVQKQVSSTDQRRVEIRLTPQGERRVGELASLHQDELQTLRGILALSRPQDYAA